MTFEELIERISPKLKGITYKIHRSSYSLSEEDLYQEAVLQLWMEYNNGKLADKTDSYVLQSCYFYLNNYIRKVHDKTSSMSMNMSISEESVGSEDVLSLENEASADKERDIDSLMEKVFKEELDRKEKEVVFFYLQGWTTRKIAERLGISHVSIVKLEGKIREKCKKLKDSIPEWLPNCEFLTCIVGYALMRVLEQGRS